VAIAERAQQHRSHKREDRGRLHDGEISKDPWYRFLPPKAS